MIRILASDFKNYEKINGQKISHPMDNSNGVVDQIKNSLQDYKKIVFVSSDMSSTHENVLSYAKVLFDSIKVVGIKFDEYLVLDGESKGKAADYIKDASLVFLCGGDTYKQHEFFTAINLKELLKNFVYDSSNFDDNEKYQRYAIIKESYNRPIYGQCNGSHILIDDDNVAIIYGETYLIHNGSIECICKNGCNVLIEDENNIKKL
ncbi:MAG: hypothetical protein HFI86_06075 [Bacilli bacterium]|nr:hypothetical protein [Bacilli bacterium]